MQGRKFLFQRSDLNERTRVVHFNKYNFGQAECSNTSMNLLSQFHLPRIQPFNENTSDLFYTPPMENKPATTPKAPVKLKKQPKKGDLRPKKLQYTEDELEAYRNIDSGVYTQDDTQCCKEQTTKCNRLDFSPKQQKRKLRGNLDRGEVKSNDKENDKNIVSKKATNKTNNRNNVVQDSSVVFNPLVRTLSQSDADSNWNQVLNWLQPRRDVGLWIECCRITCKKWRYTEDYHDPVDVPNIWYCEMNSDKSIASCNVPERPPPKAIAEDLIENIYNAGSIVWAYLQGFPWWPAIVNDCPETFTYYELLQNSAEPIRYYVTFFNQGILQSAWIHKRNLKPFVKYKYHQVVKRTKYHGIDYKEVLKAECKVATDALSLSILERLQKFSFIALYNKLYDINNNFSEPINNTTETDISADADVSSDDEIPCSDPIRNRFTLKEYHSEVICKRRCLNSSHF